MQYKTIILFLFGFSFLTAFTQVEVIDNVSIIRSVNTDTLPDPIFSLDNLPAQRFYTDIWSNENTRTSYIFEKTSTYVLPIETEHTGTFVFPCNGNVISYYGTRNGRLHTGMDIKQNLGDSVVSVWDGVVRMARMGYYGYGGTIIIRHDNGIETMYAHLSKISVLPNQRVKAGQLIGKAGRTGRASTEHLHFETRFLYEHFNPKIIIDFDTKQLICDTLIVKNGTFYAAKDLRKEEEKKLTQVTLSESLAPITTDSTHKILSETKQETKMPTSVPKPKYYVVKKGDTLTQIAKKNHTSVKKLCEINHIKETSILSLGQKIKLP